MKFRTCALIVCLQFNKILLEISCLFDWVYRLLCKILIWITEAQKLVKMKMKFRRTYSITLNNQIPRRFLLKIIIQLIGWYQITSATSTIWNQLFKSTQTFSCGYVFDTFRDDTCHPSNPLLIITTSGSQTIEFSRFNYYCQWIHWI